MQKNHEIDFTMLNEVLLISTAALKSIISMHYGPDQGSAQWKCSLAESIATKALKEINELKKQAKKERDTCIDWMA